MMGACEKCRFWVRRPTADLAAPAQGECRRYPPLGHPVYQRRVTPAGAANYAPVQITSIFVNTPASAWCGEFKEKTEQ